MYNIQEGLGKIFKEQDEYYELLEKAREKQKNYDLDKLLDKIMDNYTLSVEDYRILYSFLFGMKEDEIKKLYLKQGRRAFLEDRATEQGFETIVNRLIDEGWLYRDSKGKIKVDYDFIECLEDVDRGVM